MAEDPRVTHDQPRGDEPLDPDERARTERLQDDAETERDLNDPDRVARREAERGPSDVT